MLVLLETTKVSTGMFLKIENKIMEKMLFDSLFMGNSFYLTFYL